ncbi:radical SAM protein [Campylobacter insulaenigrae]|uniref:radical SAM protein n=1 Tax=Campylobacter insulaenigrae TaxID=260714 RepID=UPI00215372FF|nr:radical SAM protein [Campylobacter insulaenigrae]MCR6594101.1 radical SAM protein [Campylobacter insulaenigrae]
MSNIVFGPINSRRFGSSLGIDLSPDKKQCNFDCAYCELKASKPQKESLIYPSVDEVVNEVQKALAGQMQFEFLTLTANGEPSLYPFLYELTNELNKIKKNKKLLILSNGSAVLNLKSYNALLNIDIVKFSLDSAIEKTFYKIDRALKEISLDNMIKHMIKFSKDFKGDLIMETLIVEGLNDKEYEMIALDEVFSQIKPLRVDFSTIDRPPAYPVKPITFERLYELSLLIHSVPVVLAKHTYNNNKIDFTKDELLKMLKLRAQSEFDIENRFSQYSKNNLEDLIKKQKIELIDLAGIKFYKNT